MALADGTVPVGQYTRAALILSLIHIYEAQRVMKLKKGDHIVLTGGLINGKTGNTNVCLLYTSIIWLWYVNIAMLL